MFNLFLPLLIAQENPIITQAPLQRDLQEHQVPPPRDELRAQIEIPQAIRPLPGNLDETPVFNSNSPEVVAQEGILLSTFPAADKANRNAHLDYPLEGRFDIFTHHISRPQGAKKTLYQGLLVSNPTKSWVTMTVINGLSYLNSKDAPFRDLLPLVEDPNGSVYSGPGSRLVGDLLRGKKQDIFPEKLYIPPYSVKMLFVLPIPVSSARSTFLQVETNKSVYLANLALYEVDIEQTEPKGANLLRPSLRQSSRPPTLEEWRYLLTTGQLVEPRDRPPYFAKHDQEKHIYGRVAGVTIGSNWDAQISDNSGGSSLNIPNRGKSFSYPISTTDTGTFNTKQVQSAITRDRYPDTALMGHGNYLVRYRLAFPLKNSTRSDQKVSLTFQTPIKQDDFDDRLTFFQRPPDQIFFRGSLRVKYENENKEVVEKYFHLVQRRGERSKPLVTLDIPSGEQRNAEIEFFYPPDATPPQVITVSTLDSDS